MELPSPADISRSLMDMHIRLNAIRPRPAQEVARPGAMAFMRPGEDNPYPSSAANRFMVYDPNVRDLLETARDARTIFERAGVGHWFLEIGAGANPVRVQAVMQAMDARVWPHVRYPVLARIPEDVAPAHTSLEILRIDASKARAHAANIDAIWGKPGASAAVIAAAERPGYEPVIGTHEGRPVAMGVLIHTAKPGGIAYLASGGTIAEFRRRGGQSAIIAERIRIARRLGCTVCVSETVLTDPTSTRNLLRAGFKIVFEWVVLEIGAAREPTSA